MVLQDNRAYQLDYQDWTELYGQTKQPSQKPTKKPKKQKKPGSAGLFSLIGLTFLLGIGVLISSAKIAEVNYTINHLGKEYTKVMKENSELNVQLMKSTNLDTLESYAINHLGMQYPETYQYAYVAVNQVDNVEVAPVDQYYHATLKKRTSGRTATGFAGFAGECMKGARTAANTAMDSFLK